MSRTGGVPLEELLAHREWVSRLAYHLAGGAGDDVAQDAWTAALRSPPDADRPAKPWLAEVVRNIVRRRWRDQERRGRREQAFGGQVNGQVEALDLAYERMELQRMVAEEVMALDDQLRTVVVLRYVEDHDSAQIAAVLGCAPGTVRWRLKLAVDELRTRLDERCRGNRRAWTAVLAPIALKRTTATVTTGAVLMANAKLKSSILAALLLVLVAGVTGLATWRWQSRSGSSVAGDKDHERRPRFKPAQLVPGAATVRADAGSIAGIVRDEAGRPVAEAVVVTVQVHDAGARPPDSPSVPAQSTADGRFQLVGVRPAGYVVTATKIGLGVGRSSIVTVAPSQSVADVVITVAGVRAALSGTVVDSGGGGIPRARVLAGLADGSGRLVFAAVANEEGRYQLPLPTGDYLFEARADGYAPARFSLFLHLPLVREFRLHPASRVLGRVITRPGGTPLGDAEVWATAAAGGTVRTLAGSDGAYMFSELEPGNYNLLARSGAFVGRRGTPLRLGLAQEASDVDIAITRGRTISGDVKDPSGAPVKNADVLVRSETPASRCDRCVGCFSTRGGSSRRRGFGCLVAGGVGASAR